MARDTDLSRDVDALGDEVRRAQGDILRRISAKILTAAGDLLVRSSTGLARLPVGTTNGHALVVDLTKDIKMRWAAVGGGGTPSATVTTATYGTAPVVGVSPNFSPGDHDHGLPAAPTAASVGADPAGSAAAVSIDLASHEADTANPHGVTAAQAGADPAGSAAAVAGALVAHTGDLANPHATSAAQVGADPAGGATGLHETGDPADLPVGAIPELSVVTRFGTALVGVAPPASGSRVGQALGWTADGTIGWVVIGFAAGILGTTVMYGRMIDVPGCTIAEVL